MKGPENSDGARSQSILRERLKNRTLCARMPPMVTDLTDDPAFWFGLLESGVLLATLLIVLRQLRQTEKSVARDALIRAVEDHDRLNEFMFAHPELQRYQDPSRIYESWPPEDLRYMTWLTLALGRFERLHSLRSDGYVHDDIWRSWERWVTECWFATDLARTIWKQEGRYYSTRFQEYINELLEPRQDA